MKLRRSLVLIAALIACAAVGWVAPGAGAATGALDAALIAPAEELLPGRPITLRLRLANSGDEPVALRVKPELPEGWRTLISPGLTTLEAGEARIFLISLLPSATAAAGDVSIGVQVESPLGEALATASVTAYVSRVAGLSVRWINPPSYVIADAYEVDYLVENLGNVEQVIVVRATGSAGLAIEEGERRLTLAPGESALQTARVSVPRDLSRSMEQQIRVVAESVSDPGTRAEDSRRVQIIPRRLSESDALHTFPIRLQLEASSASDGWSGAAWRLDGRGPLTDRDPGRFAISAAPGRLQWTYERPDLSIAGGRQSFLLSPLSLSAAGAGVDLRKRSDPWSLRLIHVTENDGTSAWGAGAGLRLHPLVELGAHAGLRTGSGDQVKSVQVRGQIPGLPVILEGEYGVEEPGEAGGGSSAPAHGFRIESDFLAGPVAGRVAWMQRDRGFADLTAPVGRADLALDLRLKADLLATVDARHEARYEDQIFGEIDQSERTIRLGLRPAQSGWQLGFRTREAFDANAPGETDLSHEFRFSETRTGEAGRAFFHSLRWSFGPGVEPQAVYEASARTARTPSGTLIPNLRIIPGENQAGVGVRWQKPLSASTTLNLSASVDDLALRVNRRYAAELSHQTGQGATWRFTARHWTTATGSETEAFVIWSAPLELPIGMRSDVGRVAGVVRDGEGHPVADLVVSLEGLVTTTNEEGRFEFPAVPAGSRNLILRTDQIGQNRVSIPPTPYVVEVIPGERVETDFLVVMGGTVRGQVRLETSPAGGDRSTVAGNPTLGEMAIDNLVRGMVAVLRSEEGEVRAQPVDSRGEFLIDRIPPGVWEVSLTGGRIPNLYRIEEARQRIAVEPGGVYDAEFRIVPVVRTIQFIRQGTVVGGSSDASGEAGAQEDGGGQGAE